MYAFGFLTPDSADFSFDETSGNDRAGELHIITAGGLEVSGTIWEPRIVQHELPAGRGARSEAIETVADKIWQQANEYTMQARRDSPGGSVATLTSMFTVRNSLSGDDVPNNIINELVTKSQSTGQPLGDNVEEFIRSVQIAEESRPAQPIRPGAIQLADGRGYIPRRINGVRDITFLRKARDRGLIVELLGPPGTGKTTANEAVFGEDLITVNCGMSMRVEDLVGQYLPVPDQPGAFRWVDGPLITAMLEGRPLLLDDASNMPEDVQNVLLPVADHRRSVTVQSRLENAHVVAANGFWLCLSTNPDTGFGLIEPLMNRIAASVEVDMDLSIARDLGCDPQILTIAEKLELRRAKDANRVQQHWVPGFRVLQDSTEIASSFGVQTAATNLRAKCPSRDKELLEFLDRVIADEFGEALPTRLVAEV